ncbi:TPA: diphthine synthase [Candidatus Woesearchaeota archaeon]|nr:diphthine synthase [Candidatus Woesearchaeota archaeon]HII69020.1 diphthine synthase [Candidatus Woesearchaeota archaeon]
MLYLIGLGLFDANDISLRGLTAVKSCSLLFLEGYTSKLSCPVTELEKLYGKKVTMCDRAMVEQQGEELIVLPAKHADIAFLVIGEVFSATTHSSLFLDAKKHKVNVQVIHNASVLTAVGVTGLELYKFGRVASIPFHHADVTSPVEVMKQNQRMGLHTLFLLDIEPSIERYMAAAEAASYLVGRGIPGDTKAVVCGALGSAAPRIRYLSLAEIKDLNVQVFPQCLIIPGRLHFMEEDMLSLFGQEQ